MLETLIFQCSIAIAHKFDNFTNISKRLWDLVYVWSVLLSLKFQANTYSFERVVTLFVGYYFSSGHRVYAVYIMIQCTEPATPAVIEYSELPVSLQEAILGLKTPSPITVLSERGEGFFR